MTRPKITFSENGPQGEVDVRVCAVWHARTEQSFILAVIEAIGLNEWYSLNWNALHDYLRDFSWIQETRIILWHPFVEELPEVELGVYVGIADDVVRFWEEDHSKSIAMTFPKSDQVRCLKAFEDYLERRKGKRT